MVGGGWVSLIELVSNTGPEDEIRTRFRNVVIIFFNLCFYRTMEEVYKLSNSSQCGFQDSLVLMDVFILAM